MDNLLEIKNVNKSIGGHQILENISFDVPRGSIVGFVGSNGAGKSTTFKTILNLSSKDSGSVKILGEENIEKNYLLKEKIGTVFDAINLPLDLNIKKLNLVFKNIYKNWEEEVFLNLASDFSLPLNNKISTYSRGMSMKLSISVALSHGAELLLLDEATGGLDPSSRFDLLNVLEKYNNNNRGILLSSHITADIQKIATHLVVINNGVIVLKDSKSNIYENYAIIEVDDLEVIDRSNVVSTKKMSNNKMKVLVYKKQCLPNNLEYYDIDLEEVILLLTGGDHC